MKVLRHSRFGVYIYKGDHPPPHCHVRIKGGKDISVDLPLLDPRYGESISREVETFLLENLDALCKAWDQLNPPDFRKNDD